MDDFHGFQGSRDAQQDRPVEDGPVVTSTGQIVWSVRQLLTSPARKAASEIFRRLRANG